MNEAGSGGFLIVGVGVPEWLLVSVIVIALVLVGLGVLKLGKLLWAMFG
jgi:hypothetical protein